MSSLNGLILNFWIKDKRGRVLAVFVSILISLVLGVFYLISPVVPSSSAGLTCEIQKGLSGQDIARKVYDCGAIRSIWAFRLTAWVLGVADEFKAGTYLFWPGQSTVEIVSQIAQGQAQSQDRRLTIPEGLNVWEIDKLLLAKGFSSKAGAFSLNYGAKEGYFFPETYLFSKKADLPEIAAKLQDQFTKLVGPVQLGELIVASILEKEAKTPEDMALVAGVIQSRIKKGMLLQIDATVAYGWCLKTAGYLKPCDVTLAPLAQEVKIDGPYNTYTRPGLPPGPISNPGQVALKAAQNPTLSDYLFYLSTRDGSQIIFAKTLSEHLQNRRKYLGF